MESGGGLLIVQLILRIVCMVACSTKAKALNRNSVGWGFLGFVFIL